jgi:hypothetical protein
VTQVMACSCGSLFEEGDAFCGSCGNPHAFSAPPPVASRPVGDRVPGPPPTVSQPVVPQMSLPDEQARVDGRRRHRQPHEGEADISQSFESIAPAPFDADAVYLQKTLRHEPMELGLDDSVSLRTLGILGARAWLAWLAVFIPLGFIGGVQVARGGGATLLGLAFLVSVVVFWFVLLRSKVTEPIGEWRTLLADRAGQSDSYYRMINAVLHRREVPIATVHLRSIRLNTKGGPVKHIIELSEQEYHTFVTVLPYGSSLYVGWQMWRRRSGAQLVKRALVDLVKGADIVTVMLRTDRARAVREAVHLACREAVYATPDESLWVLAQQLRLPQVEQESALLLPQPPASPVLPPPATRIPTPSTAPTPTAWATPPPPRTTGPGEMPYE